MRSTMNRLTRLGSITPIQVSFFPFLNVPKCFSGDSALVLQTVSFRYATLQTAMFSIPLSRRCGHCPGQFCLPSQDFLSYCPP